MAVKVDAKEVRALAAQMEAFAHKSFPFIVQNANNTAAFLTRKKAVATIKTKFITRNMWTIRTVRVSKAFGLKRPARVGSTEEYMRRQEFGGVKVKTGKKGVDIPTKIASGEGRGSQPRKRAVRASSKRGNIKLMKTKVKAANRRQFILETIRAATFKKGGNRHIYLPFHKHPGIYKVVGRGDKARLDLVRDFSRKSIAVKRRPWLRPATLRVTKQLDSIFFEEMRKHMAKRGGRI